MAIKFILIFKLPKTVYLSQTQTMQNMRYCAHLFCDMCNSNLFENRGCRMQHCLQMSNISQKVCRVSALWCTVYPTKYAHGFVVLYFVAVMQSFIMNSHEVFIHIHQGCLAGTGAIVRLPQCQWSKPDGYGKISQCITTTKHSKAKTVCIFPGIYCIMLRWCTNGVRHYYKAEDRGPVFSRTLSEIRSSTSNIVCWNYGMRLLIRAFQPTASNV